MTIRRGDTLERYCQIFNNGSDDLSYINIDVSLKLYQGNTFIMSIDTEGSNSEDIHFERLTELTSRDGIGGTQLCNFVLRGTPEQTNALTVGVYQCFITVMQGGTVQSYPVENSEPRRFILEVV